MTRRAREEAGFTLVELLVAMVLMMIVFGATLTLLEVFQRNNTLDQTRNEALDLARVTVDRMTQEIRNAASPCGDQPTVACTGSAASSLQRTLPYDVIFQEVDANNTYAGNLANQEWVRYCVDNSTPSSETIWREVLSWTGATPPAMPTTTACPGNGSSAGQWNITPVAALAGVTNQINAQNRPLFTYYTPSGATSVKTVDIDLFVNLTPAKATSAEIELHDSVDLRNSLSSPTASINPSQTNGVVTLDGSGSSDPNGESLGYAWFMATGSTNLCSALPASNSGSQSVFTPGQLSGAYTFALVVTDSSGLSNCASYNATY